MILGYDPMRGTFGLCRRNAPLSQRGKAAVLDALATPFWPSTEAGAWCGEHEYGDAP